VSSKLWLLPHSAKSYPAHDTLSTSALWHASGHLKNLISHTLNALSRPYSSHASHPTPSPPMTFSAPSARLPASFLAPPHHYRLMWPMPPQEGRCCRHAPPCLKSQPLPSMRSDGGVCEMSRLISELFSLLLLQVW
jgi:hypothetical protein